MSLKHFKSYYNEVSAQYFEMLEDLKDMEKLFEDGMISPERVDNLKTMIAPVKDSYMTLSYVKFLLDMPNKKEKQQRYKNQNKRRLSSIEPQNTREGILNNNKNILENLKL